MYEYKEFDKVKTAKHVRFLMLIGDIFSVMFIFDLLRAFLTDNLYAMLNAIIWLVMFAYVSLKQELMEHRLDFQNNKDKPL